MVGIILSTNGQMLDKCTNTQTQWTNSKNALDKRANTMDKCTNAMDKMHKCIGQTQWANAQIHRNAHRTNAHPQRTNAHVQWIECTNTYKDVHSLDKCTIDTVTLCLQTSQETLLKCRRKGNSKKTKAATPPASTETSEKCKSTEIKNRCGPWTP